MRGFVRTVCIAALMFAAASVQAQNIPIGKRIPDVRPQTWLNGMRPLREAKLICIEFFHPASARSRSNVESLLLLSSEFARRDFQIVVVAGGDAEAVKNALSSFTDRGVAVGFDSSGECFKAFGVDYLPACIIVDEQRKTLWTGDSKTLTDKTIKNLTQK